MCTKAYRDVTLPFLLSPQSELLSIYASDILVHMTWEFMWLKYVLMLISSTLAQCFHNVAYLSASPKWDSSTFESLNYPITGLDQQWNCAMSVPVSDKPVAADAWWYYCFWIELLVAAVHFALTFGTVAVLWWLPCTNPNNEFCYFCSPRPCHSLSLCFLSLSLLCLLFFCLPLSLLRLSVSPPLWYFYRDAG